LFLCINALPSTAQTTSEQQYLSLQNYIHYVGGTGVGNYTKIQDAIDNASDGDTVFVFDYSSPYIENIVINKSIYLIGEDKFITVIDGNYSGNAVEVSADWVNISGFTIQNGNKGIYMNSDYNTITDNNILKNNYGIELYNSNNNNITGNNIFSNNRIGIWISDSSTITIGINNISKNEYGIWISFSDNITINKNNFINNKQYAFFEIYFIRCNNIWEQNYWNKPRTFPKLIIGILVITLNLYSYILFPWINIDRHPAKEPYEI